MFPAARVFSDDCVLKKGFVKASDLVRILLAPKLT